jgi:hypothetical protein
MVRFWQAQRQSLLRAFEQCTCWTCCGFPVVRRASHCWSCERPPAHELRNEIAEEFMADRVSENYAEQDVALVRSGRTRGMESEKGSR